MGRKDLTVSYALELSVYGRSASVAATQQAAADPLRPRSQPPVKPKPMLAAPRTTKHETCFDLAARISARR